MKAAIMQPYFLPYVGYFQLIAAVDLFIVYDNIQYTKSGWINRNRLCRNGEMVTFSLPLKSASDHLDVRERELAADFKREKLLNKIKEAYRPAGQFAAVFPVIERIVGFEDGNLFRFLRHSIACICDFLDISTEIRISSSIDIDHELKGQDKVLALCRAVGADLYVNAIGGMDLYSKDAFRAEGIELQFIRSKPYEYPQSDRAFLPSLSILDVMMCNPVDSVRACVAHNYELV
jgi:hypothetical protein